MQRRRRKQILKGGAKAMQVIAVGGTLSILVAVQTKWWRNLHSEHVIHLRFGIYPVFHNGESVIFMIEYRSVFSVW